VSASGPRTDFEGERLGEIIAAVRGAAEAVSRRLGAARLLPGRAGGIPPPRTLPGEPRP
jgi:hypothetical protein